MAPNGQRFVGGQDKAYDSEGVIEFLEYLCRKYPSKNLIVVWDGATIHRCHEVKKFLAGKKGRVHLAALPGYSPERYADTYDQELSLKQVISGVLYYIGPCSV